MIVAERVTRLTFASRTPPVASRARSMRRTQAAHVMPSMGRSTRRAPASSVSWGAGMGTVIVVMVTSLSTAQTQGRPADYGDTAGVHPARRGAAGCSRERARRARRNGAGGSCSV
ncbi:hypothetical protein BE17_35440 [Sorangium cellulosum]|uniref:Uncharacterized protein n=1 Tax=Sorangium cellulosum TaxID=56 RepID=A0A150S6R0_SORCE|nr:hypothetical protein BE17_35440 [Sorangium cellulosum]